jgi:hypothetical protein
LRLLYDELCEAIQQVTTRGPAERIMRVKAVPAADSDRRERVQPTLPPSLNRVQQTIARVEIAGVVCWRLIQAACARCQLPQKSSHGRHRIANPTPPLICSPLLTRRRSSRQAACWAKRTK